jgi:hypothetical protein
MPNINADVEHQALIKEFKVGAPSGTCDSPSASPLCCWCFRLVHVCVCVCVCVCFGGGVELLDVCNFLFICFWFVKLFAFEKCFASKLASYKLVVCRRSILAV